nr:ribonuclease H-like domain-containing protein [Tanacetum cinerariifolium]
MSMRTGRDRDGRVIILPLTTADEHIAIQRESKARTTLLQSILDDHVADFHYMDDAKDIWNAVKASTTNASKKMSYGDSLSYSLTTTYTAPSNSKTGSHISDFEQIEKLDLEEMDLKWQMAMLSVRVHKFEQKAGRQIDFDKKESARFNKKKVRCYKYHDGESDGVIASKEFGMIDGCDTRNAIKEGAAKIYNLITEADTEEANTAVQAYKNSLKTLEKQKRILQRNQLTLEDKIMVLSIKLENTSNMLKHSERINAYVETAKKELQTKLDNHLVQTKKWRISSKNLLRLIDSSMYVRTKVGLGYNNYIREDELGWDDSAFSVFTTNSEDVEGRPLFNRFAKTDSMKVVPPPLSGDYISLSDHIDLDESQMSYGTKSSISSDSKSVSNDFVFCNDSDKSSKVNTNDFASSDSSVKSLEPKPNDSTSCASISSVSTSENEAEIESNVGTSIQEPIIVQDLPSFSCNSFDKNENTSRTSCNKNGYFNKKAGPVHSRNKVNHQNQFVPQVVLLRTGKVNIPPARPHLIPTVGGKVLVPIGRYVVPTGRVVVPTGRYVVPAGNFIVVSTGRLSVIPTGRVLSPGEIGEERVMREKEREDYEKIDIRL